MSDWSWARHLHIREADMLTVSNSLVQASGTVGLRGSKHDHQDEEQILDQNGQGYLVKLVMLPWFWHYMEKVVQ